MFDTTATKMTGTGTNWRDLSSERPVQGTRHPQIVMFIAKGQKFPADPVDGAATGWTMVSLRKIFSVRGRRDSLPLTISDL